MTAKAFTWYEIPAGTPAAECRSNACGATIYFVPSPKTPGKSVPVSVDVDGAFGPTDTEPGRGISHFQDCADPNRFSRKR